MDSISHLNYEKIILFGSQARGDNTKYSDIDLLLVLKKNTSIGDKIRLSTKLRKVLAKNFLDADILIKDLNDINYLADKTGSVVRNALDEGIVL